MHTDHATSVDREEICFTGFPAEKLKRLEASARARGLRVRNLASSTLSVLVVGPAYDVELVRRAEAAGAELCSEQDFWALGVGEGSPVVPDPQPVARLDVIPLKWRHYYVLLGFFAGAVGAHNFYSGHWKSGAAKLLLTMFAAVFWWVALFGAAGEMLEGLSAEAAVPFDPAGYGGIMLAPWAIWIGVELWTVFELFLVKHDVLDRPFARAVGEGWDHV